MLINFALQSPLMDTAVDAPAGSGAAAPASVSPAPGQTAEDKMLSTVDALLAALAPAKEPEPAVVEPAKPKAEPEAKPGEVQPEPEPEAAEVDDPTVDLDDTSDLDAAQDDQAKPNLLDLKKPRGQRIYQSYKAYKAIADSLGQELTPESAKQHYESFADKQAMEADFLSGDPQQSANFVANWNAVSSQGMAKVAEQLPEFLASQNQQAYQALAVPVLQRYLNGLYNAAAGEQNPEVKKALTYTAQMVDWHLFGQFKPAEQIAAQPQPDAQSEYVRNGLEQIQRFQAEQQNARSQQWLSGLTLANDSALASDVEAALAPLKPLLSERLYKAAQRDFTEAVKEHLGKDAEGSRFYDIQLRRQSRDASGQQAMAAQFAQRASRAVRALAPSFLKEAGVAAKARSTERHQTLAQAQQAGTVPGGTGVPAPQSIVPAPQKRFASRGEKFDSMLGELLGTATGQ